MPLSGKKVTLLDEKVEFFHSFVSIKGINALLCIRLFIGDAGEEGELLTWVLYQMKEDTIENINRDLLFKMIEETEFLAVFFCEWF